MCSSRTVALLVLIFAVAGAQNLSLVPWPQSLQQSSGGSTVLSNFSSTIFYDDLSQLAAQALADDLLAVFALRVPTAPYGGGTGRPGAGNVLIQQGVVPPRPSPPPPPPPAAPNCSAGIQPGYMYNSSAYADGNGPRTTTDAAACCALCLTLPSCAFWSFQIDPTTFTGGSTLYPCSSYAFFCVEVLPE